MQRDMRPKQYLYWQQLMKHLGGNTEVFFNGELIYPRQLEIHLPSNHKRACNLNCHHCAGKYFQKDLGKWELDGLEILHQLAGRVPFHIYGGAYTEPLMNPYFMTYLATTKLYDNHFGIHTNGTHLNELEKNQGFLTELNRIATDDVDYLSVSLDAGTAISWSQTKQSKEKWFTEIIKGLKKAVKIRELHKRGHAIRVCYLMSDYNHSLEDIRSIVYIVKNLGVDSLRFSIPFASYNQDFNTVRKYKHEKEEAYSGLFEKKLTPFLSNSKQEKPYIFYTGPEFTDIDKFTFTKCIYCYYQLTFGADGYYYRCSTTATPTVKSNRLGKINNDFSHFQQMIIKNANFSWDANSCFKQGARCNRMGLEINLEYKRVLEQQKIQSIQDESSYCKFQAV